MGPAFRQRRTTNDQRLAAPGLQVTRSCSFSPQKYLNTIDLAAVFMTEGKRVLAAEAILSGVATIDPEDEPREDERRYDTRTESERTQDGVLEGLVREHSRLVYR